MRHYIRPSVESCSDITIDCDHFVCENQKAMSKMASSYPIIDVWANPIGGPGVRVLGDFQPLHHSETDTTLERPSRGSTSSGAEPC